MLLCSCASGTIMFQGSFPQFIYKGKSVFIFEILLVDKFHSLQVVWPAQLQLELIFIEQEYAEVHLAIQHLT